MKPTLVSCIVAAVCLACGAASAATAQPDLVPVAVAISASPNEVTAGATATIEVRLKNYRGDSIAAPQDVPVTVHSELSGDVTVTIGAGATSAQTRVTFARGGIASLVATAPNLTSATTAVVVRAGAAERAAAAVAAPGVAPAPQLAPAAGALPAGLHLAVDVLPDHVHPFNATWAAKVLVTVENENRQPIAVTAETPVQLATDIGTITPAYTTIEAGHARTAEIQLTSNSAGAGTVWAWTDTGELGRGAVEYDSPVATQLSVKALPERTVNDGRTAISITVFLEDELGNTVKAGDNIQVKLTSSVGTTKPSTVSIAKGDFVGEATLTSATAGRAEITATAAGLKPSVAVAEFAFPYVLVLMASLGGLVGALVRSSADTFTGRWWWHLLGSIGIGAVLGLLFYLLAAFGVLSLIPKIPMPLEQLPTTNAFAALILGFFGGYWARAWLPDLSPAPAGGAKSTTSRV